MRIRVRRFELDPVRVALFQAHLQRVVVRKSVRAEGRNRDIERGIAILGIVERARTGCTRPVIVLSGTPRRSGKRISPGNGNSLIAIEKAEQLQSARAGVGNFENGVSRQLVLESQM